MPIFTLEALQAAYGDALLLHWGDAAGFHTIMIDGGPGGDVATENLFPRLGELRAGHDAQSPYRLERLIVSHVDSDHIYGVIQLLRALDRDSGDVVTLGGLWHNSFADLLNEEDPDAIARALAAFGEEKLDRYADPEARAYVASNNFVNTALEFATSSVHQGMTLRELAGTLDLVVNEGAELIQAPSAMNTFDGLTVTVIGPDAERIKKLREYWEEERAKGHHGEETAMMNRVAGYTDNTPTNLSSIVVLAEFAGHRMLLTGDARGDFVLEGLRQAQALGDGPLELDVLKLPHHGSVRNHGADFFANLHARHYVISANGHDGNPEDQTLKWLVESRHPQDEFTIWLTNHDGPTDLGYRARLDTFFANYHDRAFNVSYRDDDAFSLRVELDELVPY